MEDLLSFQNHDLIKLQIEDPRLFSLVLLMSLPDLNESVKGFVKIMSGTMDSYQIGYIIGRLSAHLFTIGLTIFFWIYGIKWKKIKPVEKSE